MALKQLRIDFSTPVVFSIGDETASGDGADTVASDKSLARLQPARDGNKGQSTVERRPDTMHYD